MAWNHRSRVLAMAFAIQTAAGAFTQPNTTTDLIAAANITNQIDPVTADDPTATGTVWEANRVYLGKTATIGGSVPLRGPGGAAPPVANAAGAAGWVPGRVLMSGGWAEIRNAAARTPALAAGSTTTALVLAGTESAVDDALNGAPIQQALVGTGFRATTLIQDYVGASKTATLAETLASAPATGAAYTIPPYISYQLGTLVATTPYLSVSIWRDKKRYDYRDFSPSSIAVNVPVANEANTSFSDMTFSGKAIVQAVADDTSPVLPVAVLAVPIPPARDGKFYLDRTKLGHQNTTFTVNTTVGAASNQNQAAGQDAYDLVSGNRVLALDLNQMAVADFDLHGREDSQASMSMMETWGLAAGNRFGFMVHNVVLDPFSPGDRNGYVNLTGNAYSTDVDKSATLTIWW